MTAYAGAAAQLRIGDGAQPVESFISIGGVQVTSLQLERDVVDATDVTSDGWKQLATGGVRHVRIEGNGVFTNTIAQTRLLSVSLAGTMNAFEIVLGNGDVLSGEFVARRYQRLADIGEPESFRLVLESSGDVILSSA